MSQRYTAEITHKDHTEFLPIIAPDDDTATEVAREYVTKQFDLDPNCSIHDVMVRK